MSLSEIKNFQPNRNHSFVFDANIWISACWPDDDLFQKQALYEIDTQCSKFFNKCANCSSTIYLPSIVLSEVINRICRKEFQKYRQAHQDISFKQYRALEDYARLITDIQHILSSQIIKLKEKGIIELVEDNFVSFDLTEAVKNLNIIDFNDSLILNICKDKDAFLVTNDRDLFVAKNDINILTALKNKNL